MLSGSRPTSERRSRTDAGAAQHWIVALVLLMAAGAAALAWYGRVRWDPDRSAGLLAGMVADADAMDCREFEAVIALDRGALSRRLGDRPTCYRGPEGTLYALVDGVGLFSVASGDLLGGGAGPRLDDTTVDRWRSNPDGAAGWTAGVEGLSVWVSWKSLPLPGWSVRQQREWDMARAAAVARPDGSVWTVSLTADSPDPGVARRALESLLADGA